jgi:hypothetical protein
MNTRGIRFSARFLKSFAPPSKPGMRTRMASGVDVPSMRKRVYVALFRLKLEPPNSVMSFALVTVTPAVPGVLGGSAALAIFVVVPSVLQVLSAFPLHASATK